MTTRRPLSTTLLDSVMRLWFKDRENETALELPVNEVCDKFLLESGAEDIYHENPDTSVKEVLRWWMNQEGWTYDENEFEELYNLVLVEGEWRA